MVYHNICPTCICKEGTHQHSKQFMSNICTLYVLRALIGPFSGNWFCRLFMENVPPFNHIKNDNEFMKCIETISQSPEAGAFPHHDMKIFNPFDIYEDDNDIIEYHGHIHSWQKRLLQPY